MTRLKSKIGFAMIDLLACLSLGGIVVALVLPTLQTTRESARIVDCKNRLRTIAIAAHDFHDAFMRLPPGTLNYEKPPKGLVAAQATPGLSRDECQNLSALFLILPFLEPEDDERTHPVNIYDSVDGRLPDLKKDLRQIVDASEPPKRVFNSQFRYGTGAGVNYPVDSYIQDLYDENMEPSGVVTKAIPNFNCPADELNAESELPSIAITMPYYDGTSQYGTPLDDVLYVVFEKMELAKTNYVAVAGTTSCINVPSPLAKWAGAMTGRIVTTLEMVANLDGSSRTFMFGESLGDVGGIARLSDAGEIIHFNDKDIEPGKRAMTRAWAWGGIGILASSNFPWGTRQHPDIREPDGEKNFLQLLGNGRLADPESFSSVHKAGVNFAMADASVHTVPRDIGWQLYYGNGGLRDGTTERGF